MIKDRPKISFLDTGWAVNEYRKETGHYGAIAYFRLVKPMEVLRDFFDITFYGKNLQQFGDGENAYAHLAQTSDLIFSKHIDNGQGASNLLALTQHFGKKILVDLDDNYLQIRDDNPAAKDYAPMKGGRYFLGAFMSLSDGLTVSTNPLASVYSPINKSIDVLPNCNDVDDWKNPRRIHKDNKIRIGYAGSITHNDDLELIWRPMGIILDKYPNVKFEICGAIDPKMIVPVMEKVQKHAKRDITGQMWFYGGTQAWLGYTKLLASFGWDIGLAPLVDEPFNHCKSHIKWMDYAMVGCPTVASKVYPYFQPIMGVKTIEHEKTGLLCETEEDWIKNIESVILKADFRRELADNAYTYIKENWQYKDWAHLWKKAFEKYL